MVVKHKKFGDLVRTKRDEAKLSQEDVAARLDGLGQTRFSQIERGMVSVKGVVFGNLLELMEVLGITFQELLKVCDSCDDLARLLQPYYHGRDAVMVPVYQGSKERLEDGRRVDFEALPISWTNSGRFLGYRLSDASSTTQLVVKVQDFAELGETVLGKADGEVVVKKLTVDSDKALKILQKAKPDMGSLLGAGGEIWGVVYDTRIKNSRVIRN